MRRQSLVTVLAILALIAGVLYLRRRPKPPETGTPAAAQLERIQVKKIGPTRTVMLPVAEANEATSEQALTITPGAEDELPEGPQAFDVLLDGTFVVADPIAKRVAFFDSSGRFRSAQPVGFAATEISLVADGRLLVRRSGSGDVYRVDAGGVAPVSEADTGALRPASSARLTGRNSGIVYADTSQGAAEARVINVRYEDPPLQLVSLRKIGADSMGNVFVALEAGTPDEVVDVKTIIRKYSADGRPLAEMTGVTDDMSVQPEEPFRVRGNLLYMLAPRTNGVAIHIWDSSAAQ